MCAGENIAALDTSLLQAISKNGGDKSGHGKKSGGDMHVINDANEHS